VGDVRWLSLFAFAAGCGENPPPPLIVAPDAAPRPPQEDPPCGYGPAAGVCNPLTQTGCEAGCKCGWIYHTPTVGYIGCNPIGDAPVGASCTVAFSSGDTCDKGAVCVDGACSGCAALIRARRATSVSKACAG
jgi:hypothetical protein